jgi:hypothetical protein
MACLDGLVPGHLPPDIQTLRPPPHSRRSILSPEKEKKRNKHPISTHAYTDFNQTPPHTPALSNRSKQI